jgi:HEAT repeat protein
MAQTILLLLSLALQNSDDITKASRELLKALQSDRIEEREDATRKLKALGKAAIPELEKATQNNDKEVVARVRQIIDFISLQHTFPESLKKTFPNLEERLSTGGDSSWTTLFLEATSKTNGKQRYPALQREDLNFLAQRAVRGALTTTEKVEVSDLVTREQLRSAIPELAKLLKDDAWEVRREVSEDLVKLGGKEAIPELTTLLEAEKRIEVRDATVFILGSLKAKGATQHIVQFLHDENAQVRKRAVWALAELEAREAIPQILPLLKDRDVGVRTTTISALGDLKSTEAVPELKNLLQEKETYICISALRALGHIGARGSIPDIMKFLRSSNPDIRSETGKTLVQLNAQEVLAEILDMLKDEHPSTRAFAATLLGQLDARKAEEELVTLLQNDKDKEVCKATSIALCRIGSRAGVQYLLQAAEQSKEFDLSCLNALRQPEAWNRLKKSPYQARRTIENKKLPEILAEITGLRVEMSEEDAGNLGGLSINVSGPKSGESVLSVLERVMGSFQSYQFIVEKDKLSILPTDESLEFWKTWWQQEQKRKK